MSLDGSRSEHEREESLFGVGANRANVLVVETNQLLMLPDDPRLAQRRPAILNRDQLDSRAGRAGGQFFAAHCPIRSGR